jgi:hypothetical protein
MTLEERALEIVEFDDALQALTDEQIDRLQETIAEALRTVRRETLEEAARVAETFHPDDDRMDRQIKIHVAQAIRSLAVKEGAAQWQDISTAPKDGSKILAWDGDYVIVRADPSGGWSDDFEQYLRLDKWMPIPAPPAAKEGEDSH